MSDAMQFEDEVPAVGDADAQPAMSYIQSDADGQPLEGAGAEGELVDGEQSAAGGAPSADEAAAAPKPRVTSRYLSKYERARLLGVRSKQISMGAPPLVDPQGDYDSYQIALKELKQRRIPIIVRRHLPDGSYEDWKIDDPDLVIL